MLSLIVAASENNVIGSHGKTPWHLKDDITLFRNLTIGKTIILGRKTFESIGHPLEGRQNIVLTSTKGIENKEVVVAHSISDAIKKSKSKDIYVVGGGQIFQEAEHYADKIYLTRVHETIEGDTFFKFDTRQWREVSRQEFAADSNNDYDFSFITLVRI